MAECGSETPTLLPNFTLIGAAVPIYEVLHDMTLEAFGLLTKFELSD